MTPEIGTYTITYTVANPADTAKIATKNHNDHGIPSGILVDGRHMAGA